MQFQNRLGDIASGSTIRIEAVDAIATGAVAAGGSDTTPILAPPGWIYRVRSMELYAGAPGGATTGTHGFTFVSTAGITEYIIFDGFSTYNRPVQFTRGMWKYANHRVGPSGGAAQQLALRTLFATEDTPLVARYHNGTDAIQNGPRIILFTFEKVAV